MNPTPTPDRGIAQPCQIFQTAGRWQKLQIDACLRQNFSVTDTQLVIGAPLRAGSHHDSARRQCRINEDAGTQKNRGHSGNRKVGPKSSQIVSANHQALSRFVCYFVSGPRAL
jgi:hypothetical protein